MNKKDYENYRVLTTITFEVFDTTCNCGFNEDSKNKKLDLLDNVSAINCKALAMLVPILYM